MRKPRNGVNGTFEETKKLVLDYIFETGGVTTKEIAQKFNMSTQATYRYTKAIVAEGYACKGVIKKERRSERVPGFKYEVGYLPEA